MSSRAPVSFLNTVYTRFPSLSATRSHRAQEEWHLDWQEQEQKDSFLGKTRSKSRWSTVGQVEGEPFLTQGLNADDEVIEAEVHSLEKGWVAKQVWFVEGGDFVRRVVTTKDEKRAESTLVYEQQ